MSKLLPAVIVIIGLLLGGGAGLILQPKVDTDVSDTEAEAEGPAEEVEEEEDTTREYVKLNNQFIIPVVSEGIVSSLVVLSLTIEVNAGGREQVFTHEPKLRDALLSALFDHANLGGFDGSFTQALPMDSLRRSLQRKAEGVLGDIVKDVLVLDIVRQDIEPPN